jgi:myosin heavy subunit
MLIRICLVVAIIAGLVALGLSHLNVREKIIELRDDRDLKTRERDEARADLQKTREELATTKEELDRTKIELDTTKTQLAQTERQRDEAQGRATKLTTDLKRVTTERNQLKETVDGFTALGMPTVEAAQGKMTELKQTKEERDVIEAEKRIVERANEKLRYELAQLIGEKYEVVLPAGLRGKIVSVDPKYQFVVLDIGVDQGVIEHGKLLINRNGKLVGRVQVTQVLPSQSIANIMPDWKQGEPIEGDEVIY